MIVEFDRSFPKSLEKVNDSKILKRIIKIIIEIEKAPSLKEINNCKKLTGYKNYFRIRIGDYRLGIELINQQTIRFILLAHRKDIYKYFP